MKNQKARELIKRASVVAISFVTAASMTACSMSLKPETDDMTVTPAVTASLQDTVTSLADELSTEIDGTDFTDGDAVGDLADEIISEVTEAVNDSDELPYEFEAASLVRVVDGDTIVVDIDGEGECKVRLIGVDTPESVASQEYLDRTGKENTAEGKEASEYTKSLLSDVETVYLAKDTSNTDKYGRLLRYVWLEVPDDPYDMAEVSTKMLNAILVRDGYANVATYEPDTEYEEYFEELADLEP